MRIRNLLWLLEYKLKMIIIILAFHLSTEMTELYLDLATEYAVDQCCRQVISHLGSI